MIHNVVVIIDSDSLMFNEVYNNWLQLFKYVWFQLQHYMRDKLDEHVIMWI